MEIKRNRITVLVDFPAVNFIKEVHEDEDIEDYGVLETVFLGPWLIWPLDFSVKQVFPLEEKRGENDYLESSLAYDISPHDWVDNAVVLRVWLTLDNVFLGCFSC